MVLHVLYLSPVSILFGRIYFLTQKKIIIQEGAWMVLDLSSLGTLVPNTWGRGRLECRGGNQWPQEGVKGNSLQFHGWQCYSIMKFSLWVGIDKDDHLFHSGIFWKEKSRKRRKEKYFKYDNFVNYFHLLSWCSAARIMILRDSERYITKKNSS